MKLDSTNLGNWTANVVVSDTEQISSYVEGRIREQDYTAFEIFPTDVDIPSGTTDSIDSLNAIFSWNDDELKYINEFIRFSNLEYKEDVQACKILLLEFYTNEYVQGRSDIIVDWGDDSTSVLKSDPTVEYNYGGREGVIRIQHEYSSFKPTIVKIFGEKYYLVRTTSNYDASSTSILRRVFDSDLRIAKNVTSVVSLARRSNHILRVEIGRELANQIKSCCNMFQDCHNLQKADIDSSLATFPVEAHAMFLNCYSLKDLSYIIPNQTISSNGLKQMFKGCVSLTGDILNILPQNGFSQTDINIVDMFNTCSSLTCSDYDKLGNILWNDTSKRFTSNYCFTNSSISDYVPISFGGTQPDSIIHENTVKLKDELNKANENISKLNDQLLECALDGFKGNIVEYSDNPGFKEYEKYSDVSKLGNVIYKNNFGYKDTASIKTIYKTADNFTEISADAGNIGYGTFDNLEEIHSDTIEKITGPVFRLSLGRRNSILTKIALPNCKSIASNTIETCDELSSIDVPNIQTLGWSAIRDCPVISSFECHNINTFGANVFGKCPSLQYIDMSKRTLTSIPTIDIRVGSETFGNNPQTISVYVPESMYDNWSSNANWQNAIQTNKVSLIAV